MNAMTQTKPRVLPALSHSDKPLIICVYIEQLDRMGNNVGEMYTYSFNLHNPQQRRVFAEQSYNALAAGQSVTTVRADEPKVCNRNCDCVGVCKAGLE
jgi:hypothetical protein